MGLDLIGWSIDDVNPPAISHPTWLAGCEMLIGIFNAAVVLVLEFVIFAVRIGVAAVPECLNELLTLFFVRELHEGLAFVVGDDPTDIFVQPVLIFLA